MHSEYFAGIAKYDPHLGIGKRIDTIAPSGFSVIPLPGWTTSPTQRT